LSTGASDIVGADHMKLADSALHSQELEPIKPHIPSTDICVEVPLIQGIWSHTVGFQQ